MIRKIAGAMSLIVFAICLVVGGLEADNSFATTVGRALLAMLFSFVIGLVIGSMAQKMLEENLKSEEEKLKNSSAPTSPGDR
jgi:NhaP-type Na+/H+ or K+/H+ antiporter